MGVKTRKLGNVNNQIVEWQSSIFVGDGSTGLTAVAGRGYFINTAGGTVTVTLPASPNIGDRVSFKDWNRSFGTNAMSFASNKFDHVASQTPSFSTDGQSIELIYTGDVAGWQLIGEDTVTGLGAQFIAATGGTVSTVDTNFKVHVFTGDGCFVVSNAGNPSGSTTVDYLVIAGGGGGGWDASGGGGAGGYRFSNGTASGCFTAGPSPLGATALPVTAQTYPITVGAGGAAVTSSAAGNGGSNSVFSTITSAGGGRGGRGPCGCYGARPGGSGGGAKAGEAAGNGNDPPVSPPQGNNGATGPGSGGGGGGAGAAGSVGQPAPGVSGAGGAGLTSCITGSPVARGGGGAGGNDYPGGAVSGGSGGGGDGGTRPSEAAAGSGTANTGGGGGGAGVPGSGGSGAGGKGVVVIRYKFQ